MNDRIVLLAFFSFLLSVAIAKPLFIETSTFRSPVLPLKPGLVANKYFFDAGFKKGHVAVKQVFAEVVTESGKSVPLTEAYIHHWTLFRYFQKQGTNVSLANFAAATANGDFLLSAKNLSCHGDNLVFGSGSETRRTDYDLPDPYGYETGNPEKKPMGYDEKWLLNIHVIDTRGVVDSLGCLECRCDLYNVTSKSDGKPLPVGYKGGMSCCPDQQRCRLLDGVPDVTRKLYLKYVVHWTMWNKNVLPAKMYGFDVTVPKTDAMNPKESCQGSVEYQINPCGKETTSRECIYHNSTRIISQADGYVILVFAHQHVGGIGSALYAQNGRLICVSRPIYGRGRRPGNEKGYVVGMTTCRPKLGTVKVAKNEILGLESNYSSAALHTGVMGLFGVVVAAELPDGRRY